MKNQIEMKPEWLSIIRDFPKSAHTRLEKYVIWCVSEYINRVNKQRRPELERMAAMTGIDAIGNGSLATAWNIPWHALNDDQISLICESDNENFISNARRIVADIKLKSVFILAAKGDSVDSYLKRLGSVIQDRPGCIGIDPTSKAGFQDIRKTVSKHKFPIGWVLINNPSDFIGHSMCKGMSMSCDGLPTDEFLSTFSPKNRIKPPPDLVNKIRRMRVS